MASHSHIVPKRMQLMAYFDCFIEVCRGSHRGLASQGARGLSGACRAVLGGLESEKGRLLGALGALRAPCVRQRDSQVLASCCSAFPVSRSILAVASHATPAQVLLLLFLWDAD